MLALLLILIAAQAQGAPLPERLANGGFERSLEGWSIAGHHGLRADVAPNVRWSSDRGPQGRHILNVGWRARSGAPPGAEMRVTTRISARLHRGRRLRISALTRAPDFAHHTSRLIANAGAEASVASIGASATWRRHDLVLLVPRDATFIEIGFVTRGTAGELDADDVRLEVLR